MTDTDIENLYKSQVGVSHYAGLRAVFDAGYLLGASLPVGTGDPSLTVSAPATTVPITTP